MARELNFDGLVGPFHHYAGFAFGNLASTAHEGETSNPRQAALQGLVKMRALSQLGVGQAVLPPHARPDLDLARRMGFSGDDHKVLSDVASQEPLLLAACYSPSSMWTANCATVSPSADSRDGRVHLTPANLQSQIHRSIEPPTTARILKSIFRSPERFAHHEPLPSTATLGDEGAANHTRLCPDYGRPGLQLFVYGRSAANPWEPSPKVFPARHTREASAALARLHALDDAQVVLAQQNPHAIDQGVFHNDVISVGNRGRFFFHEEAFIDTPKVIATLRDKYAALTGEALQTIEVPAARISVATAVSTYLFNSQLVSLPDGRTLLVAPAECHENDQVRTLIDELIAEHGAFDEVRYFDLRQSMHGGGGPACLRLRVVLDAAEEAAMAPQVVFTPALDTALQTWIEAHFRDRLLPRDLADPLLVDETRTALDRLTEILGLGSIYPFQRTA